MSRAGTWLGLAVMSEARKVPKIRSRNDCSIPCDFEAPQILLDDLSSALHIPTAEIRERP